MIMLMKIITIILHLLITYFVIISIYYITNDNVDENNNNNITFINNLFCYNFYILYNHTIDLFYRYPIRKRTIKCIKYVKHKK